MIYRTSRGGCSFACVSFKWIIITNIANLFCNTHQLPSKLFFILSPVRINTHIKGVIFNSTTLQSVNFLSFAEIFLYGIVLCSQSRSLPHTCPFHFWIFYPPLKLKTTHTSSLFSYEWTCIQNHRHFWKYFHSGWSKLYSPDSLRQPHISFTF